MSPTSPESPSTPTSPANEPSRKTLPESSRTVDVSSDDSFPASDPPAWTPITSTASQAEVSDAVASEWKPQGETPQERARHWAQHAADLLDAGRHRAFCLAHLAEDVLFQVGADLQLSGRDAVSSWLQARTVSAGRTTHRINAVTTDGNAIVVESDVTFFAEGGATVCVAEACSYRLRGDRASRVHLYTTVNPSVNQAAKA